DVGVQHLEFSQDGQSLVGAGSIVDFCVARVFDASTGELRAALKGHTGRISHMAFSPDNRLLYTAEANGTVKVWDATRDDRPPVVKAPLIFRRRFSPDGTLEIVYTRAFGSRPGGPGKVVYTPLFPGNPDPPSEVSIRDRAGKEHFCFKGHTGGIVSALF